MIKKGIASFSLAFSLSIVAVPATSIMEQKAKMLEGMSKEFSKPAPVLIDKNGKLLKKPTTRAVSLEAADTVTRAHKYCSKNACCDIASRLAALEATSTTILNNTIEILAAVGCGNATLISAADINPNGYLITVPGVYCLSDDVTFAGTTANLSAIVIDSDDVVLLGHGHTLGQTSDTAGTNGILVNGHTRVIIDNVTVTGFTGYGVRLNPISSYVTLNKINALENGALGVTGGGIGITSAIDSVTHDIYLNEVNASGNEFIGLTIAGANKVIVRNSIFNNNTANALNPVVQGISSWGVFAAPLFTGVPSHDLTFIDCQANGNTALNGAIGFEVLSVPAFALPVITDVNFIRCVANSNLGGGDLTGVNEGEGIVIAGTENFIVKDCQAYSNQSLATAPSGLAGFYASVGFGVPFSCANGIFENCHAANNSGAADVSAGFRVISSNNIVLENCVSQNHINTNEAGEAWGFTTDTNLGNPTAFGTPVNNQFTFKNCVAQNNVAATTTLGGGFKFISQVNSTLSNSVSSGNGGYGILAGDPAGCEDAQCASLDNIINNNQILGNSVAGILDTKAAANNAYYLNVSRSNGPAGAVNYSGLPAGTPIRLWLLPAAPNATDSNGILDPIDNMDVRP